MFSDVAQILTDLTGEDEQFPEVKVNSAVYRVYVRSIAYVRS